MLVLKRKEGQRVKVTHVATGETFWLRTYDIATDPHARVQIAFDDADRRFLFEREEKIEGAAPTPPPPPA